jgi:hypothetical protein
MPTGKYPRRSQVERFLSRIDKNGPVHPRLGTACWIWKGAIAHGYGTITWNGKSSRAHRVSYLLAHGNPGDLLVLHECDNPPCVNPSHLRLGTNADNMHDRDTRGRTSKGDRHYARTNPERLARGERHGSRTKPERLPRGERHGAKLHPETIRRCSQHPGSKLDEAAVITIRKAAETEPVSSLARRFSVSRKLIDRVIAGLVWKHVADPSAKGDAEQITDALPT